MTEHRAPTPWAPTLAAVSGSVMVGFMPLMARHLYAEGMSAPSMLVWRYIMALVPLGLAIAVLRLDFRAAWRQGAWVVVIIGATLGAGRRCASGRASRRSTPASRCCLFYTYPALTLALDRIVLKRPIHAPAVICIAVILCGAALVTVPGLRAGGIALIGLAWAIPAPAIYAIYLLVTTSLLRRYPTLIGAACLYLGLAASLGSAPCSSASTGRQAAATWTLLVFIALGPGALTMALFSYSAPRLGPSSYAIIANCELVTVVAVGVTRARRAGHRLTRGRRRDDPRRDRRAQPPFR